MDGPTPGDWHVSLRLKDNVVMVVADGQDLAVCTVTDYGDMPAMENARILAASKVMLAALTRAKETIAKAGDFEIPTSRFHEILVATVDEIDSAIAKATGK